MNQCHFKNACRHETKKDKMIPPGLISQTASQISSEMLFGWSRTVKRAPAGIGFPLICRLGCRTSARLDSCVIKGLVPTLRLSLESREGRATNKEKSQWSIIYRETQQIQTKTLNFHVWVSAGWRLEVKYHHLHGRLVSMNVFTSLANAYICISTLVRTHWHAAAPIMDPVWRKSFAAVTSVESES